MCQAHWWSREWDHLWWKSGINFFLFLLLAILIGWRKRGSIALPFITMDTLVFMARRCHFKEWLAIWRPGDYQCLLCCVTDLHFTPFRVSHHCLGALNCVSAFTLPYTPEILCLQGHFLLLTLFLLCYYPAPSTGCFAFYFLPQYHGPWVEAF